RRQPQRLAVEPARLRLRQGLQSALHLGDGPRPRQRAGEDAAPRNRARRAVRAVRQLARPARDVRPEPVLRLPLRAPGRRPGPLHPEVHAMNTRKVRILALLAIAAACGTPEVGHNDNPPGFVVSAVFDPTTGQIPLPNDLALLQIPTSVPPAQQD